MEIIEDTTNFIASRLAFIIYRKRDTTQQGQQFGNGMRWKVWRVGWDRRELLSGGRDSSSPQLALRKLIERWGDRCL